MAEFPQNNIEALALLYVQQHSEFSASPERLCEAYWDAYYRIANVNSKAAKDASGNKHGRIG